LTSQRGWALISIEPQIGDPPEAGQKLRCFCRFEWNNIGRQTVGQGKLKSKNRKNETILSPVPEKVGN
jgi:hypothetical protein